MSAIIGQILGKQLIEALGLPERVTWFELRVAVNQVVTVTCEHHVDSDKAPGIVAVLSKYELVERQQPNDASGGHKLVLPERARSDHR